MNSQKLRVTCARDDEANFSLYKYRISSRLRTAQCVSRGYEPYDQHTIMQKKECRFGEHYLTLEQLKALAAQHEESSYKRWMQAHGCAL